MAAITFPSPLTAHVVQVVRPYSLQKTLACGQAFRWRWDDGAALGIFAGRRVRLAQDEQALTISGLDEQQVQALQRYLGADEPLQAIENRLRRDRILQRILPHTTGIAIMRQDPWECLVSFIVSAFNNIPKIEFTLDRLCRRFGKPVAGDGWLFPSPSALAAAKLRELRFCLLGYRAPYLAEVAKRVAVGDFVLSEPAELPYGEARKLLLALPGVGDKVADCVLLFAYGKSEAFPVDVWVKRAVERWYFGGRVVTERRIREFARQRFGVLAGYAQQHLFYHARSARLDAFPHNG